MVFVTDLMITVAERVIAQEALEDTVVAAGPPPGYAHPLVALLPIRGRHLLVGRILARGPVRRLHIGAVHEVRSCIIGILVLVRIRRRTYPADSPLVVMGGPDPLRHLQDGQGLRSGKIGLVMLDGTRVPQPLGRQGIHLPQAAITGTIGRSVICLLLVDTRDLGHL